MKEINEKSEEVLLTLLDSEINKKCINLREKQNQTKLKKMFFISCIAVLFLFLMQIIFKIFNVSFLNMVAVYEVFAVIIIIPMIPGKVGRGY